MATESGAALEQRVANQESKSAAPPKTLYTYKVPPNLRDSVVTESISVRKLSIREYRDLTKAAGSDSFKLAEDLAKRCLVAVDRQKLNKAEGEEEQVWERMSAQTQQLVISAYDKLHNVNEKDEKAFLDSEEVEVG